MPPPSSDRIVVTSTAERSEKSLRCAPSTRDGAAAGWTRTRIPCYDASNQHNFAVFLLGQGIALALASVNAASSTMEVWCGIRVPTFQTGIVYLLLAIHLLYRYAQQQQQQLTSPSMARPCPDDWAESVDQAGSCVSANQEGERDGAILARPDHAGCVCASQLLPQYRLPFTALRLKAPWFVYLVIAILDLEANYLTMLSFQRTTLTSTTLLGSLSVPSVMVSSHLVLGRVFSARQIVGVLVCVLGGTMTVWSDLDGGTAGTVARENTPVVEDNAMNETHILGTFISSYPILQQIGGDALAVAAAFLYGLNDTVAEYTIKNVDRVEYLGMLGLFGALVSFSIQVPLLEWNDVVALFYDKSASEQGSVYLLFVWYVSSLLAFYVATSWFLMKSDATLLNLSLQTCDLWAIIFSVTAQHTMPKPLFFVAVTTVVIGVFLYEISNDVVKGNETTSAVKQHKEKAGIEIESGSATETCHSRYGTFSDDISSELVPVKDI